VVGAGGQVFVEALVDPFRGSVGDQSVDEWIAAGTGDIGFGESMADQVAGVVAQAQVGMLYRGAANPEALFEVLSEHHLVFGCKKYVGLMRFRAYRVCFGTARYG
jgi:hypothetical protein